MYLPEIAKLLNKSVKAVDRLSRRKKNPLPIRRGKGRPYGFRSEIAAWLVETQVETAAERLSTVFC